MSLGVRPRQVKPIWAGVIVKHYVRCLEGLGRVRDAGDPEIDTRSSAEYFDCTPRREVR
jgi:hypothetical protein